MKRCRADVGFTLIEILFVVFMISIVAGFAVPRFNAFTTINLRSAARQHAAMLRYCFNQAVLTGNRQRLVLNFENREFWLEEYVEAQPEPDKSDIESGGLNEDFSLDNEDDEDPKPQGEFVKTETFLVRTKKLPDGVNYVSYQPMEDAEVKAGEAYIYFYPEGESSGGELILSSREENFMTLFINQLTGEVVIEKGRPEDANQS